MIETLITFISALLLGIFTGIMPGFGGLAAMALSYPFLLSLEPHNIILFYVVLISIDQYYNGLTAIIFGVPGASMSVPSVIEGHSLFRQGRGGESIIYSAVASWFCSLFAILFVLLISPIMFYIYKIWNTEVQMFIFVFMFLSIIFISRNSIITNALLFIGGLGIGMVGYDITTGKQTLTFNLPVLYDGLPVMCVVASLLVIPIFLNSYFKDSNPIFWPNLDLNHYKKVFLSFSHKKLILLRCSIIGSIGGFIPGLTYGASSLLAYTSEKAIQVKNKKYTEGNIDCLIASEGSNNAGAFTQLVPLLFLGIPITASEAMVYNLLEIKGLVITLSWFQEIFWLVIASFLLSSTIGLVVAGKYVNILKILNGIKPSTLYSFVFAILLVAIYIVGSQTNSGIEYLLVTICLLPFGVLLFRFDTSPLLYGFFLHDTIFYVTERFSVLYNMNFN